MKYFELLSRFEGTYIDIVIDSSTNVTLSLGDYYICLGIFDYDESEIIDFCDIIDNVRDYFLKQNVKLSLGDIRFYCLEPNVRLSLGLFVEKVEEIGVCE